MKPISAATLALFMARTITLEPIVQISLVDNSNIGNVTATADEIESVLAPAENAIDGITAVDRTWAFADALSETDDIPAGQLTNIPKCFPGCYPIDEEHSAGWWGDILSDGYGDLSSPSVFTLTYTPGVTLQQIAWWADDYLSYPVDFTIEIDTGAGFVTLATVTDNTETFWTYDLASPTVIFGAQISITKINRAYCYPKLLEFQAGLVIDVSDLVQSFSVNTERSPDNATLQIGSASAASFSMRFANNTLDWSPIRKASPYSKYLRDNRKITVAIRVVDPDPNNRSPAPIALGTFLSRAWDSDSKAGMASVEAQDRMSRLREQTFTTCPLYNYQSPEAIIASALGLAGVNRSILATTSVLIPYAWCLPTATYFQFITQVAASVGGFCYFDADDVFHFEDARFLAANRNESVLTLTDSNAIITPRDKWSASDTKSAVQVRVNALTQLGDGQVWELTEALLIPANSQITINVVFQGAVDSPYLDTLTGGADVAFVSSQFYATTGSIVIENTGAAAEYLTALTIFGQLLQSEGENSVTRPAVLPVAARLLTVDNPFVQTVDNATSLAQSLLDTYKDAPARLTVNAIGLPFLDLGDRVHVQSDSAGIDADYWVIRHSLPYAGSLNSDLDLYECPVVQYPTRWTGWHEDATVTHGGSIAQASDSGWAYFSIWEQYPADIGDTFTQALWIGKGTYSLYVSYVGSAAGGGICTFSINGTTVGAVDMSTDDGQFVVLVGAVTLTTDGQHTLRGVASKSAGSYLPIQKYWLVAGSDTI